MNWSKLVEFTGIDLQDSGVLSWFCTDDQLLLELEVSIWPSSEHYEAPQINEYTCYKSARLIFVDFNSIDGILNMSEVKPSIGPDGEKDFGNIDNLEILENGFHIIGDFGSVLLEGGIMRFEFGT